MMSQPNVPRRPVGQSADETTRANLDLHPHEADGPEGSAGRHQLSPPAGSPFPAVNVTLEEYGSERGRQGDDPIREGDNVR